MTPVEAPSHELATHVANVANRLRLVQIQLGDQDPSTRADYLREELERAVANIPPDERERFLALLKARFPSLAEAGQPVSQPLPPQSGAEPLTPEALIHAFSSFSPEQQDVVREAIGSAQAPAKESGADLARQEEMTELLRVFVDNVGAYVWNTWCTLSETRSGRRSLSIKEDLDRLAEGDPEVTTESIRAELDHLQRLAVTLIGAVHHVGRHCAQMMVQEWSPDNIAMLTRAEGKPVLQSWEFAYWQKFRQMADRNLSEDALEHEITSKIAEYVRQLVRTATDYRKPREGKS